MTRSHFGAKQSVLADMTTPVAPEWSSLVEAFTAAGFPWISQLRTLKIQFELPDFDCAGIYNFFASLFALSIFAYCTYAPPDELLTRYHWPGFIVAAAILSLVYISIFLFFRHSVEQGNYRGLVLVNLVVYVLIFVCLTAGFSLLKLRGQFFVVDGTVRDSRTMKGVDGAIVTAADTKGEYSRSVLTDKDGNFTLIVAQDEVPKIKQIIFTHPQYEMLSHPIVGGGIMSFNYNNIRLQLSPGS